MYRLEKKINMRLSANVATVLTRLAKKHFGEEAKVRLFGSRVDDSARGGDIDLQIFAPNSTYRDEIASQKGIVLRG